MKDRKKIDRGIMLPSKKDCETLVETLELLTTPGLLKSVRKAKQQISKGEMYSMREVFGK